jgi:protein involved in polysaccharide export with SLBB domain
MVAGVCNASSAYDLRASRLRQIAQIGLLFLICSLTTSLHSQSSNPGGSQNSGTQSPSVLDCTDPLMASSSQCSASNQGEFNQNQGEFNPSLPNQGRTTAPPNGNYSDTEQLTRQGAGRNPAQQFLLPQEELTEFQNFVISTSGKSLPIFGADLFRRVPSTFAPLDMTPVPSEYVIGPGDELRIRVWGQVNLSDNVRVDRSGEVFLPQVGTVHIAGIPSSALEAHLREAIGRVYRNFDLTADLGQIRSIQVYVSGEARRPGVYTVSSLSTLVDALFASGGPSVQGSLRHIQLRRGSTVVTDFDLYKLLIDGDKSKDVKLESGDVIFIPPVGPQAAVLGSVKHPAIYELLAGEQLSGLLANAGGASAVAAEARVSIERIEEHHDRQAMDVAYDASGLATPVADGDLVRVYSIVPKYQKTVTLRGNTANPGRFAWRSGMHVSDLIPDKDSLITRNYWWRRARLGLPAPEELDMPTLPVVQGNQNQIPCQNQYPYQFQSPYQNQNLSQNLNPSLNQSPDQSQGTYPNQNPYQNPCLNLNQNPSLNQDQGQYPNQYPNQNAYPNQSPYQNQSQNQNLSAQQRGSGSSLGAAETAAALGRFPGNVQRNVIRELASVRSWEAGSST